MASAKKAKQDSDDPLRTAVEEIAGDSGALAVAVAYYDYETGSGWSHRGDRWVHAASTIKVPVLLGVFAAIDRGELALNARIHVRNRFLSAADGTSYRVGAGRDANAEVHAQRGRTMKVHELVRHMIVTSSNLATNLLVEVVGIDAVQDTMKELGLDGGIEFRRGVEDERAYEAGINNRCTAEGMLGVLRAIEEGRAAGKEGAERMVDILHDQEFRSGIPAGVPEGTRVAHKTGEISTVAHDAGIVYPAGRKPYALVVLTEWDAERTSGRKDTIASLSRAVFRHLTEDGG